MAARAFSAASIAALTLAPALALAQNNAPPEPPQARRGADVPLVPTGERYDEPIITIEGGAGVMGYPGGAASVGPAWNARVTSKFTPRLAAEGNYVGGLSSRPQTADALMMASFDVSGRYNLLRLDEAPVQPFVTAGVGYAAFIGDDGDLFTMVVPVGAGIEKNLTRSIKLGGRFQYRPAFFDHLGRDDVAPNLQPGGDTFQILAQVGGGF